MWAETGEQHDDSEADEEKAATSKFWMESAHHMDHANGTYAAWEAAEKLSRAGQKQIRREDWDA